MVSTRPSSVTGPEMVMLGGHDSCHATGVDGDGCGGAALFDAFCVRDDDSFLCCGHF